jgi:hypothetical protein
MSPCSFDIHGELVLGTFPEVSLRSFYNSKKLREFRRQTMRRSTSRSSVCKKCLVNRVPAVLAQVYSNDYLQIDPSYRDKWIKKRGVECWLQLVQKNLTDHPRIILGSRRQKLALLIDQIFRRGKGSKSEGKKRSRAKKEPSI